MSGDEVCEAAWIVGSGVGIGEVSVVEGSYVDYGVDYAVADAVAVGSYVCGDASDGVADVVADVECEVAVGGADCTDYVTESAGVLVYYA